MIYHFIHCSVRPFCNSHRMGRTVRCPVHIMNIIEECLKYSEYQSWHVPNFCADCLVGLTGRGQCRHLCVPVKKSHTGYLKSLGHCMRNWEVCMSIRVSQNKLLCRWFVENFNEYSWLLLDVSCDIGSIKFYIMQSVSAEDMFLYLNSLGRLCLLCPVDRTMEPCAVVHTDPRGKVKFKLPRELCP